MPGAPREGPLLSPMEPCGRPPDDRGAGGETWLKRNILLREISLIEFALNRWKLPCCDDSGDITLPEEFGTDEEPFTINVHQQQGCTNQIDVHDEEE